MVIMSHEFPPQVAPDNTPHPYYDPYSIRPTNSLLPSFPEQRSTPINRGLPRDVLAQIPETPSRVGRLAARAKYNIERAAELHPTGEKQIEIQGDLFVKGFRQLNLARQRADSGRYELELSDLVQFGGALAYSGSIFFNFLIDTQGHDLPDGSHSFIGLEDVGRQRFHQAHTVFAHALQLDPNNTVAQAGLARMQSALRPVSEILAEIAAEPNRNL